MTAQAPDHGGRILLLRESVDDGGARYRVELATGDSVFEGSLRIAATDGAVSLDGFTLVGAESAHEPPAWLLAQVAPLARTLFRGRREDPAGPGTSSELARWPRRLHRWRSPREARG